MSYVLSPAWHPGLLRRDLHSGDKTQECLLPPAVWIRPSCPQMPTSLFFVNSRWTWTAPHSPCCVLKTWCVSLINWDLDNSLLGLTLLSHHFSSGLWSPSHPQITGSSWMEQWISSSGTIQQKQPDLHQISISKHKQEWTESAGLPGEVFCCASVNKVKISEDMSPRKCCCKTGCTSALSLSNEAFLYSLKISHVLSQVLPQQTSHESASARHDGSLHHMTTRKFHFSFVSLENSNTWCFHTWKKSQKTNMINNLWSSGYRNCKWRCLEYLSTLEEISKPTYVQMESSKHMRKVRGWLT